MPHHHYHPHRDRLHRLARIGTRLAFHGAATAAGAAPVQLAIWWITHT
ncbi:hypothetical protein [Spirillospora sp. CA-128828]